MIKGQNSNKKKFSHKNVIFNIYLKKSKFFDSKMKL